MRQLSESEIIAFRQCPKGLRLEIQPSNLRDDSDCGMVFAIGNQVGEVARRIYDPAEQGRPIQRR